MPLNTQFKRLEFGVSFKDVVKANASTSAFHQFNVNDSIGAVNVVATNFITAISNVSQAAPALDDGRLSPYPNLGAKGGSGAYPNSDDKAIFEFGTNVGTRKYLSVPAPLDTIFLSDGYNVDQNNAAVKALIALMLNGAWTTEDGNVLTTFISGTRGQRRREIRAPRLP